ncbi:MAG: hypothetical protein DRI44_02415 [Chlamydiae bacterium]|nr:MAG: hypothetical protein DRI44_02415 [Chlamydiota bacterium]
MKKIFFTASLLIISATNIFADTTSDVAIIRDRLINWAQAYQPTGDIPRKSVAEYLKLLNSDGNFSDAPSTAEIMTGRLLFMAQAFKNDSKWKGNLHLKTNLYSAMEFWLDHNSGNSGWSAGCFSEPAAITSIGFCLYDAIQNDKTNSPENAARLDKLLNKIVEWANSAWTINNSVQFFHGANITYRLMGMIGRAGLSGSPEIFNDISNLVASTFTVGKLFDTGRFADGSWHEYNVDGGQNYWLGFGKDWLSLTLKYCAYLKGTQWELTDEQLNILADGILDGWQWQVYRNQGIYSLCGKRNLLKSALQDNGFMVKQINLLQKIAGDGVLVRDKELEQVKNRMSHPEMSFPSLNASKYFYKSDLMIHGRSNHYVVVKMISNRTIGPESYKGEAKKNYHFGEGSTMILRSGNEYKNARVAWNFRAIPGTTVEQKTGSLPDVDFGSHANSFNAFAGGISDGHFGLCAFQLHRASYYNTVTANKGYFFFDNGFLALGSKIRKHPPYQGNEVWTTIDQAERKTDISYFTGDDLIHTISLNSNSQLSFTNITNGAWFYCNNKGYILPPNKKGVDLKLMAENRTGDWHDLDKRYPTGDIQSVNIFQLSISHQKMPKNNKYAYFVFPDMSEEKLKKMFKHLPVKILENSDSVQAVQVSNITEIVFYKAGKIVTKSPFIKGNMGDLTISVDKPAIVMLGQTGRKLNISISDPTQYREKIIMTINKKLKGGNNIIYNSKTGNSKIMFSFPQDIYLGKTVTQEFEINN